MISHKSVLDGELAVPCILKPALCRIEYRQEGFAEFEMIYKWC